MGMGLAFTAVADDPIGDLLQPRGSGLAEALRGGRRELVPDEESRETFTGANPYPGVGVTENEHKTTFVLPTLYVVVPADLAAQPRRR